MEYIIFILLTSWAICGLYISAQEGMIFNFATRFFEQKNIKHIMYPMNYNFMIIRWISNPIIMCPTCMASVWGILSYWFYFGGVDLMTIFCVFILAYSNSVFIELYYKLRND